MCVGGSGGGGDGGAAERERQRQANIAAGYNKIQSIFGGSTAEDGTVTPGFDDAFYNQRQQDYIDYATPQIDQQYNEAVKKLTFLLAQSGRLNSSTRGTEFAKLQQQYDLAKTGIVDKGRSYAADSRSAVERARGDLVNLNASLADPAQVAAEAQNRLAVLQTKPAYDPLSPLFTNVGENLSTQADLERRQMSKYNTGLFTPTATGSGSSRVIG